MSQVIENKKRKQSTTIEKESDLLEIMMLRTQRLKQRNAELAQRYEQIKKQQQRVLCEKDNQSALLCSNADFEKKIADIQRATSAFVPTDDELDVAASIQELSTPPKLSTDQPKFVIAPRRLLESDDDSSEEYDSESEYSRVKASIDEELEMIEEPEEEVDEDLKHRNTFHLKKHIDAYRGLSPVSTVDLPPKMAKLVELYNKALGDKTFKKIHHLHPKIVTSVALAIYRTLGIQKAGDFILAIDARRFQCESDDVPRAFVQKLIASGYMEECEKDGTCTACLKEDIWPYLPELKDKTIFIFTRRHPGMGYDTFAAYKRLRADLLDGSTVAKLSQLLEAMRVADWMNAIVAFCYAEDYENASFVVACWFRYGGVVDIHHPKFTDAMHFALSKRLPFELPVCAIDKCERHVYRTVKSSKK